MSNNTIGRANNSEFHINTDTLTPISTPLRRVPLHKESIVKQLLEHYEELGIIEMTDSPFRAPTVLVEKKNVGNSDEISDKYRLCVDFRFLNDTLEDSGWPTPSIEHCLDAAVGSVYLSSLDFNSGYHQIPCTPKAKQALAFSPGFGFPQFTWNVMPQGIKPAANCFQRTMEKTFNGLEQCMLPPFYDDIMVKGSDFSTHLSHLKSVLQRIKDCGYTLNALKCNFFRTKIKYLGYIIENGKISPDPARIEVICNFPVPKDVKSLRRFLGMCQFCSRFLPDFNTKLIPLHNLTRKNVPFNWTSECEVAFDYAKSKLLDSPVLRLPSLSDTFILETDASDGGIGCCLKAVSTEGEEFIVSYYSSKLSQTESRWNIVEKEAYAVIKGVEKYRHYLIGKEFTLKTDNRILTYLKSTHTSKSRKLLNWALRLSEYHYQIVHIPSTNNQISDCLSRLYEKVNVIFQLEPELSNEELLRSQKNEETLREAFNYLDCKIDFDLQKLGLLKRFRKQININSNGLLCWRNKVILPEIFRQKILKICHDHPTSGHFKEDRTWANLTAHYFWPGAHNDVINWVKSCNSCNEFDVSVYTHRPLQPISIEHRFEFVCYDLAGPFVPKNIRGNVYALIIVDHFTKWPEIIPLQDATAPTIARNIFDHWCCRYGIMDRLHSDGASNVHGAVVNELCKLIGTVKSKSSRLHPQGDGMAESTVKILKSCVRKQVDKFGQDWDLYLQSTAFAMRSNINSSTKHTPAELIFGDNLRRPIDVSSSNQCTGNINQRQAKEFATSLTEKLQKTADIVNDNVNAARKKMKEKYDKNNSTHDIKIGDHVMLWWPYYQKNIPRSFQPRWKGPWVVSKLFDKTNCRIQNDAGETKNVHLNQLKPIEVRDSYTDSENCGGEVCEPKKCYVSFNDFCEDSGGENVNIDDEPYENELINYGWCNIDETNILPQRTRNS